MEKSEGYRRNGWGLLEKIWLVIGKGEVEGRKRVANPICVG